MNWLPIKSFEGFYEVSETGLVRSLPRIIQAVTFNGVKYQRKIPGKVLSTALNIRTGYTHVSLYRGAKQFTFTIHRLVALAFLNNPNSFAEVDHLDGKKTNNEVSNLEWVSKLVNMRRAFKAGLYAKNYRRGYKRKRK